MRQQQQQAAAAAGGSSSSSRRRQQQQEAAAAAQQQQQPAAAPAAPSVVFVKFILHVGVLLEHFRVLRFQRSPGHFEDVPLCLSLINSKIKHFLIFKIWRLKNSEDVKLENKILNEKVSKFLKFKAWRFWFLSKCSQFNKHKNLNQEISQFLKFQFSFFNSAPLRQRSLALIWIIAVNHVFIRLHIDDGRRLFRLLHPRWKCKRLFSKDWVSEITCGLTPCFCFFFLESFRNLKK